jgi:hypothetical protein
MWVGYYHRLMAVTLVQVNATGDFSNYTCNSNPLEGPATHFRLVSIACRSYETKPDFAGPPCGIPFVVRAPQGFRKVDLCLRIFYTTLLPKEQIFRNLQFNRYCALWYHR